ncbi:hypothetical protein [Cellulomonas sp. ATA003]|uniref:hypothetical protein n=1 Tax=Cellulomonas sp. ATA003 TaxID=3073064 RepID=UPI002872DCC1|nr:hypothetical protein [Cellulomonas sp. ATA003]WNB84567.1 hypothetical protein REH70_12105 [Cellulomonas sp. ATA003]
MPRPAPPMFLAWASDDEFGATVVEACTHILGAWSRAGASIEAHAYASGGHGFGIRGRGTLSDHWFGTFLGWLAASGF